MSILRITILYNCLANPSIKSSGLFTTWFQCWISLMCILFIRIFSCRSQLFQAFFQINFEIKSILHSLPACCSLLLKIVLASKTMQYLNISTFQNLFSLSTSLDVILGYLILHRLLNKFTRIGCFGVLFGILICYYAEKRIRWRGYIYAAISCLFGSSYNTLLRRVLRNFENNESLLYNYFYLMTPFILTPFVWYAGEFDTFQRPFSTKFWVFQFLNGILFFVSNILMLEEKRVGEIETHVISYCLHFIALDITSFVLFWTKENMSVLKLIGTTLILIFSLIYEYEFRRFYRTRYPIVRIQQSSETTHSTDSVVNYNL